MTGADACVACVGVGSNLADPRMQVSAGLQALAQVPQTHVLRHSRLYRSKAWGVTDQPDFVNAAAMLETTLAPQELMQALLAIERRFGRERRPGERWGPRILDLDLLLHGDRIIDAPGLHVPHPHLHERAFVLVPLAEIAPDLVVPERGRVADLLARVDAGACRALESA